MESEDGRNKKSSEINSVLRKTTNFILGKKIEFFQKVAMIKI